MNLSGIFGNFVRDLVLLCWFYLFLTSLARVMTSVLSLAVARAFSRDHLLRGFTPHLRASFAQATLSAEAGRARWGISDPRVSLLYGRAVVSAALLSATLKGEERAIIQFVGRDDDAVSRLYAEALACGEVRASASGRAIVNDDGASVVGVGVADAMQAQSWDGRLRGSFSVTRILYGAATPVQGIVEADAGDVEGDLASYFTRSEQRRASVRLDVHVDAVSGRITYAGGALVEAIATGGGKLDKNGTDGNCSENPSSGTDENCTENPSSSTTAFDRVNNFFFRPNAANANINAALIKNNAAVTPPPTAESDFGILYANGISLAEAASRAIPAFSPSRVISGAAPGAGRGAGVLERVPLDYFCRCSKTRFIEKLILTLSPTSLDAMVADAKDGIAAHLSCAFCNSKHAVTAGELSIARRP